MRSSKSFVSLQELQILSLLVSLDCTLVNLIHLDLRFSAICMIQKRLESTYATLIMPEENAFFRRYASHITYAILAFASPQRISFPTILKCSLTTTQLLLPYTFFS
jgi:hypothetical protein